MTIDVRWARFHFEAIKARDVPTILKASRELMGSRTPVDRIR
jgi:hypothetical protein